MNTVPGARECCEARVYNSSADGVLPPRVRVKVWLHKLATEEGLCEAADSEG